MLAFAESSLRVLLLKVKVARFLGDQCCVERDSHRLWNLDLQVCLLYTILFLTLTAVLYWIGEN